MPANKSRQPLWLKKSKWTPQHLPPSLVQRFCDDSAWPKTTLPATDSFLPQPFPVVLLRVLGKPQQAFEGQSQTVIANHSLSHTTFATQSFFSSEKTWFYQYIQETWIRNSKGSHRQGDGLMVKDICSALIVLYSYKTLYLCASSHFSAIST